MSKLRGIHIQFYLDFYKIGKWQKSGGNYPFMSVTD
jgi:hypothetical protein